MLLRPFAQLPARMQNEAVKYYYDILNKKKVSLFIKRFWDIVISFILTVILLPLFAVLAIAIKLDSKGPVFFRQVRVGRYGKTFRIFKFRSMVQDADKMGVQLTTKGDPRITRVGKFLRITRFDELPQVMNILIGDMSLIGARPEVPRYVEQYTPEMTATLLLAPGLTGVASIAFRNENSMLDASEDPEKTYVEQILPKKMEYNLNYLQKLCFWYDIYVLVDTFLCLFRKD